MMKTAGKTTTALLLAGALLGSSMAIASEPVPMTPEGLEEFVYAMPSDDMVYAGLQQMLAACGDRCANSESEYGLETTLFFDRVFERAGYDYGATLVGYVDAREHMRHAPASNPILPGALQWSGVDVVMMSPVGMLQGGYGQALVNEGVLSLDQLFRIEGVVMDWLEG